MAKKVVEEKKEEIVEEVQAEVEQKEEVPENPKARWYVINAYSGHEKRVAELIQQRIDIAGLNKYITQILVPTQNKIVVTEGKKKSVEDKILPGYVLIKMELNNTTWPLVRDTQGVIGFAGMDKKPTPLNPNEVKAIMRFMEVEQPAYQSSFAINDAVNILEGPFKDFPGKIVEINESKGKVKVLISIFGRETPVELDFTQVKRF
jgi:transcriptional antiterminator NusG